MVNYKIIKIMLDNEQGKVLKNTFNPEGSSLRLYQKRLFSILCYIDGICTKYNITYWLSSGTCLGAVRHGGFIPWDDDLDIEMFEDDYRKFQEVMSKIDSKQYIFQTKKNDPGYLHAFGKVRDLNSIIYEAHGKDSRYKYRGCYVDVFHLIPSNSIFLFRIANNLKRREEKYNLSRNKTSSIVFHVTKCINNISIPVIRLLSKLFNKKYYRHYYGTGYPYKRNIEEILPVKYANFEGKLFPIPQNADAYLRRMYGDYEKIPDIKTIKPHLVNYRFNDNSCVEMS